MSRKEYFEKLFNPYESKKSRPRIGRALDPALGIAIASKVTLPKFLTQDRPSGEFLHSLYVCIVWA
jgi:hypothetical protein